MHRPLMLRRARRIPGLAVKAGEHFTSPIQRAADYQRAMALTFHEGELDREDVQALVALH